MNELMRSWAKIEVAGNHVPICNGLDTNVHDMPRNWSYVVAGCDFL